jgi:hypothetical protein
MPKLNFDEATEPQFCQQTTRLHNTTGTQGKKVFPRGSWDMEQEEGKRRGGHVAKPRQQGTSRERQDWLQRQMLIKRWRSKESNH